MTPGLGPLPCSVTGSSSPAARQTIGQQNVIEIFKGLFSNLCNLIVLVSPCNEYFIWLPRVMAGEEALGDLWACPKIAGREQQSPV